MHLHLLRFFVGVMLALPTLAADPKLLSMVPGNAEAVLGADIRAIMNSGIAQEFMRNATGNSSADLNEMIALTGVDPRRDLHEVVAASLGTTLGKDGKTSSQGLVFLAGNFNPDRVAAAMAAKGGKKSMYKGRELWNPEQSGDGPQGLMTFLESGVLMAGDEVQVKRYLDGPGASLNGPLRARVDSVSGRYDLWMVSAVSPATLAKGVAGQPGQVQEAAGALQGDMFQKIESVQGGLKLGPQTTMGVEMIAATAEDANALMNVMQFFQSMLAGGGGGQGGNAMPAGLGKMLSSIRMSTQSNTVLVSMSMPEKDIVDFLKSATINPAESGKSTRPAPKAKPQPKQEEIIIIQ